MLLRAKGETPGEIAGMARAFLRHGVPVKTAAGGERGGERARGEAARRSVRAQLQCSLDGKGLLADCAQIDEAITQCIPNNTNANALYTTIQ